MTIERLKPDLTEPLVRLMLELWPECSFAEEWEAAVTMAHAHNEIVYLAHNHGQYVAFIHVTLRHDYVEGASTSPTAYIEALYVKHEYRKQGIAKMLMEQAIAWAKQQGCRELASDTEIDNNTSVEFHKNTGFEEVNRIVCFIKTL